MSTSKSVTKRFSWRTVVAGSGALALVVSVAVLPATAASKNTAKSPVTVAMISQITGAGFGSPEAVAAAKAVVHQINAAGGLGGHKIILTTCNDKETPTDGANCARNAVKAHAVAVVEGISLQDTTMLPILNAAGIPLIESPTAPLDWVNKYNFPTDAGTISLWGGEGILMVKSGCTKIGILYDSSNPTGGFGPSLLTAGVKSTGTSATVVGTQGVSETSPDLSSAIATLETEGATCIGTTLVPGQFVDAVTAARASADPSVVLTTIGPAFPEVLAAQLGAAAKGVLVDSVSYLPTDPRASAFTKLMAPYGTADETSFAENVYGGFKLLQSSLKKYKGVLTSANVRKALNSSTDLTASTYPKPIGFKTVNSVSAYRRLTNLWVVGYSFNGTEFVPLTGSTALINAEGALKDLPAS